MKLKSTTKLDNGLTRYLFEDGSYIEKEAQGSPALPSASELAKIEGKEWRNVELASTDWIYPLGDHPQHAAYITYRKALRDWPSTADFPNKKPVLGS
tara:strand:- start:185 stop:475 length:291 start_codon:yes stop_codon:yes gene_type:complete